jgi:dTDP-4-dehydrorhamnose 3,5-epimerase
MRFSETAISGVWLVEPIANFDARGSFARTFSVEEFKEHGLASCFTQHSISHTYLKHTLRGLHFQTSPYEEEKLVTCIQGAIWDVAVDLRPESPTYLRWTAAILSPERRLHFHIPKGCAHGFQSLRDDSVVAYLITTPYKPEHASGVRYDDAALAIDWPAKPAVISEKDKNWPLLTPQPVDA